MTKPSKQKHTKCLNNITNKVIIIHCNYIGILILHLALANLVNDPEWNIRGMSCKEMLEHHNTSHSIIQKKKEVGINIVACVHIYMWTSTSRAAWEATPKAIRSLSPRVLGRPSYPLVVAGGDRPMMYINNEASLLALLLPPWAPLKVPPLVVRPICVGRQRSATLWSSSPAIIILVGCDTLVLTLNSDTTT
jgi:hypothetical protein